MFEREGKGAGTRRRSDDEKEGVPINDGAQPRLAPVKSTCLDQITLLQIVFGNSTPFFYFTIARPNHLVTCFCFSSLLERLISNRSPLSPPLNNGISLYQNTEGAMASADVTDAPTAEEPLFDPGLKKKKNKKIVDFDVLDGAGAGDENGAEAAPAGGEAAEENPEDLFGGLKKKSKKKKSVPMDLVSFK